MTEEVAFPTEQMEIQEFEHPNGETGILIGLRTTEKELSDAFDVRPAVDTNDPDAVERNRLDDTPVVIPFKHKADGATNFREYRDEGDETVIVFDDDHYAQVRNYLKHTLIHE